MIVSVCVVLWSVALVAIGAWYLKRRYSIATWATFWGTISRQKILTALTIGIFLIASLAGIFACLREWIYPAVQLRFLVLFWGVYLLAIIDYFEKKIPNRIIAALLIIRVFFLIYEVISNFEYIGTAIKYPLFGALIGGGILAVVMLVSQNGIGMGDIKLFIAIGAYVGSTGIIRVLFYTVLAGAVVGAVLLLTKKAKAKDAVPFAPFAFLGICADYALLLLGG